ncbi:MAG: hypothetical protein M1837_007210 [Sclerophora amabilis]|nr:MAG: hypothetical protein M1837_007210 [Sclerophora amabilis]
MAGSNTSAVSPTFSKKSSASTFSCITVRDRSVSGSTSITPQTSLTDTASGSVDASHTEGASLDSRRVKRARRSLVSSYNENILAGTAKRRVSSEGGKRTISGETLVNDAVNSGIVGDGITALNLGWSMDTLPALGEGAAAHGGTAPQKRSMRAGLVEKAKTTLAKSVSILGKRGREAVNTGKEGAKELAQGLKRRASLRTRVPPQKDEAVEPATKKAKLSTPNAESVEPEKPKTKPTQQPCRKRWLSQGLYIGQDRTFDPRLTEAKNKLKVANKQSQEVKQRSILPLPMFGGERLLKNGRSFRLPFDIFSPLPPGQPKPEEWRKTQKNVFVGDAASFWKNNKLQELSRCVCTPESGCDEDCQNRFMFYECDGSNCNIGADRCTNRSFEDLRQRCKAGGKYNIGVEVIKTHDRGYGVRSNRTFQPNQIIVEYAGEIITQDECDTRMRTRYKDNECYYLMLFDQNMIIDATRGSIARFVNHACEPNCRMEKWTVAGKPRMALFAGERGIMTGEELTYDYNFDPFSVKNVQPCRCGSSNCRGVLGPRPKEPKNILSTMVGHAKSAKRTLHDAFSGDKDASRQKLAKKQKMAPLKSSQTSSASVKTARGRKITTSRARAVAKKRLNVVKKTSLKMVSSVPSNIRRGATIKPGAAAAKSSAKGARQLSRPASYLHKESQKQSVATRTPSNGRAIPPGRSVRGERGASIVNKVRTLRGARGNRGKSLRVVTQDDV